jgi:hypothetical protein
MGDSVLSTQGQRSDSVNRTVVDLSLSFLIAVSFYNPIKLRVVAKEQCKCKSKHMVDRLNPQPARLRRRLNSKFSGGKSSFLRPGRITFG